MSMFITINAPKRIFLYQNSFQNVAQKLKPTATIVSVHPKEFDKQSL